MLLRVHTSERDQCDGKSLCEAVVLKAREMGWKGATVLRGVIGHGHDSHIRTSEFLNLSMDLPLLRKTSKLLQSISPSTRGAGLAITAHGAGWCW